jgi:DNA-binding transcriptional LysR family regulator
MLERGEVHFAINVVNVIQVDHNQFGSFLLPRFHIHAIYARTFDFPGSDPIEIRKLTDYPLLLPNATYATRNLFDAACRIAGLRPNIRVESGSASTLLALASGRHGIAVVPSILRSGSDLRVARVTHRGELLQIAPAVIWDKRRTLPRYAAGFSELLAEHLRAEFPDGCPKGSKFARKTTAKENSR